MLLTTEIIDYTEEHEVDDLIFFLRDEHGKGFSIFFNKYICEFIICVVLKNVLFILFFFFL